VGYGLNASCCSGGTLPAGALVASVDISGPGYSGSTGVSRLNASCAKVLNLSFGCVETPKNLAQPKKHGKNKATPLLNVFEVPGSESEVRISIKNLVLKLSNLMTLFVRNCSSTRNASALTPSRTSVTRTQWPPIHPESDSST